MDDITLQTIDLAFDTIVFASALAILISYGSIVLNIISNYAGII